MPEANLPFLRGSISLVERYQSPKGGGGGRPPSPPRNPAQHRDALLAQFDAIVAITSHRLPGQRDQEASREIIALTPEENFVLQPDGLADARADVRLVSVDPDTGTVLLDASTGDLQHLRRKAEAFADDAKLTPKGYRRNEGVVAPIKAAGLASDVDLAGPRFRESNLGLDEVRWFEIACRGGTREPTAETDRTRGQIQRTFAHFGLPGPREFLATERLILFAKLSVRQLRDFIVRTDCVFEFDLPGPEIRDWLILNDREVPETDLQQFQLGAPAADAPAVVLLDSGLAAGHPLLGSAVLSVDSVVPGQPPGDSAGHGTLMAGVALHDDIGALVESNEGNADHWLQSVKLIHADGEGTADERNRALWPTMTADAVALSESYGPRHRVFSLAITAPLDIRIATWWSQALDQLAYNDGHGRLILVSIGNTDVGQHLTLAQNYPQLNLVQHLDDPAQAANAVTVGAFTERITLPPDPDVASWQVIAPSGGVSLCTRAGLRGAESEGIKPDVVFEGGNAASDGTMIFGDLDTLGTLTTGHEVLLRPLVVHSMTSLATANAARFLARLVAKHPSLSPQTARGLLVHSASWTQTMLDQLPGVDDRLSLCGYGVPDFQLASACTSESATVIVEDSLPNAVFESSLPSDDDVQSDEDAVETIRKRRIAKFFRLPVPEELLLSAGYVELRVTLSYFAEPSTFRRRTRRGLELEWDMQGPGELEGDFRTRINKLLRTPGASVGPGSFDWKIGKQRRSRGTVQSDRWEGQGALLAGSKLIAVYPVLGWWDRRKDLQEAEMAFTLIVSVRSSGLDIYTPIQVALAPEVEIPAQ